MKTLLGILTGIGSKVAGGVSGPLGWLASLFIDRIIKFGWSKLKAWIDSLAVKMKIKKEKGKDQTNADAYKQTLNDGATEADQVAASLGVLNSRDPDHKP